MLPPLVAAAVDSRGHRNLGCILGQQMLEQTRNIQGIISMSRSPTSNKTAILTMRLQPQLKLAAQKAAVEDRRSLTNWIEVLIIQHCQSLGKDLEVRP
jgi:hypothetical protein